MKKTTISIASLILVLAMLFSNQYYFVKADDGNNIEIDEEELAEYMVADNFRFSLPGEDETNLLTEPVALSGDLAALNNQTRMQVLYNEGGKIYLNDTAYLTYKIKNNSNNILSIGTMVYFRTTSKNLCAYVLTPMVYNAETGAKLNYKTSYEYSSGKFVLTDIMPTVEIPPKTEVFIAIPFVGVNDITNYVPGIQIAENEAFSRGTAPKKGCLWSNNEERTAMMEEKLKRDGDTDCLQMQFFIGGNGTDAAGIRSYKGAFDLSITELYAISKQDYYEYAITSDPPVEDETEEETKDIIGEDPDGSKYTTVSLTDSGLAIAPSFDVNGNIAAIAYTRDEFATVAKTFAECGFNRVYVVTTRGGIPAASSASNQWNDPGDTRYKISNSLILSKNSNFEFLYACHREGLEVIAVYKPYEGGGVSKGYDADMSNTLYYEETVGGYWTGYDAFISSHPEMRLERKSDEAGDAIVNDTITKIEAAFILGEFTYHAWTGGLRRESCNDLNQSEIKVYVSKNNLDYVEYEGDYTLSFKVAGTQYLDENGWDLFGKNKKCCLTTIENIEIGSEYQYIALAMEDNSSRYIIPQSMINVYNAKGDKLPTTVGTSVRCSKSYPTRPEGYLWGAEDIVRGNDKDSLKYFQSWGFEFDFDGNGVNNSIAYYSSYVYGIARGNFQYAKGTLCEAYPEVREYWLDEVESLLLMGYDGIEVRLQAHSYMISDYAYYGFNEPLMEAFIQKYGYDPREEETVSKETAYNIATLRGEFFMDFMEEAAKMVKDAGKTFGFHMRSAMIDTTPEVIMNTALHQCFCWAMPKIVIDWKQAVDLCDTITIKQNWANNYRYDIIKELTDYAVSKNVQVWVTAYTQQYTNVDEYGVQIGEANVPFFNNVAKDDNVYGIQMYEWDPYGSRFTHAFNKLKEALNYIPREVE